MNKDLSKKQVVAAAYIIISALMFWSVWLVDGLDILVVFWIIPVVWCGLSIYICGFYVNKLLLQSEFWKRHDILAKFVILTIVILVVLVLTYFLFPFNLNQ